MNTFHTLIKFLPLFISLLCTYCTLAQKEQENGFKEVILTSTNADNRYASYNKKGTKIVFESNRDGHWQIYTMNIDGSSQKQLISSDSNDRRPKWHPTKNLILFESDRTGINEIYSFNLDSNTIKQYSINLNGNKYNADFAPNGVQLIFSHPENKDVSNIYTCSTKGKRLKKVISNNYKNKYPNLSPRGDAIIYFSNKNTQGETNIIYTYNLYNKDKKRLSYFKNESTFPRWSNKNSRRIVYSAKVDDILHSEIFIMHNDGTHKTRITYNNLEDTLPNWSPNNVNLLITGFRNGNYQICKILLKEPLNPNQKPLE
ncbi:hypothetical protein [Thalassobellus sediminis]|uniref:hypothetical protein n=1 Tax=Thalassobellus sediminis TaxID=3367753 RepID=UPI0037B20238